MLMAGATQKELAAPIQCLKVELEIARSKLPQRVTGTALERNHRVNAIILADDDVDVPLEVRKRLVELDVEAEVRPLSGIACVR